MARLRPGPVVYLTACFVLSWIPAIALSVVGRDASHWPGVQLLRASLLYAAVLGWQSLAAFLIVRRWCASTIDPGLRPVTTPYSVLSVVAPMTLLAVAAVFHLVLHGSDLGISDETQTGTRSAPAVLAMLAAFVATLAVLWLQAFGEELGWRGYLLGALMRDLGAWPGLLLHGVLWGLWYAPVFLLGGADGSTARLAEFVVTCALLGTLLGWLRLASGSVFVSAAANAILTVGAGLPLLLQGTASTRSAIFEPVGWLPMAACFVAIVAVSSLRASVAVPLRPLPDHVN